MSDSGHGGAERTPSARKPEDLDGSRQCHMPVAQCNQNNINTEEKANDQSYNYKNNKYKY